MPAISTFRVDKSMKNRTRNRCKPRRVHTSTVKKSVATIVSQCRLRNSFHVVFRLRSDPMSFQNRSNRTAGKLVAQMGQGALDPSIAPIPVLLCHAHHQSLDLIGGARPTG